MKKKERKKKRREKNLESSLIPDIVGERREICDSFTRDLPRDFVSCELIDTKRISERPRWAVEISAPKRTEKTPANIIEWDANIINE